MLSKIIIFLMIFTISNIASAHGYIGFGGTGEWGLFVQGGQRWWGLMHVNQKYKEELFTSDSIYLQPLIYKNPRQGLYSYFGLRGGMENHPGSEYFGKYYATLYPRLSLWKNKGEYSINIDLEFGKAYSLISKNNIINNNGDVVSLNKKGYNNLIGFLIGWNYSIDLGFRLKPSKGVK